MQDGVDAQPPGRYQNPQAFGLLVLVMNTFNKKAIMNNNGCVVYSWTALFVFGFFLKNVLRIFAFCAFAERHIVLVPHQQPPSKHPQMHPNRYNIQPRHRIHRSSTVRGQLETPLDRCIV